VLRSLLAVVAVIVVGGDVRDLLLPENPDEPARQRRLAGAGISDDAEQDWSRHQALTVPLSSRVQPQRNPAQPEKNPYATAGAIRKAMSMNQREISN
jgi:hypothetical protein